MTKEGLTFFNFIFVSAEVSLESLKEEERKTCFGPVSKPLP